MLSYSDRVELVSSLRYALQHGCLANGNRIPPDDRDMVNYVRDEIRKRVAHELLTVNQSVVYGGVLFTGNVSELSDLGRSMCGFMSVLDEQVVLLVVRQSPDDDWHVSSARVSA